MSLQSTLAHLKKTVGIEVYQLLYDITPILLPQCFQSGFPEAFTGYMSDALAVSDGIVTISEHSRVDALRFCADRLIPAPPIEVFRLGDELDRSADPEPVAGLDGQGYILSVGTFESRKNYALLYQVWKLAAEQGRSLPRLVIVGRVGWAAGDTLYALANDPQVRDSVRVLHFVSDGQLAWLYENCLMTIYPSLYEGWGLPIAESLAHGKLCLASSASAMPEIAGDLIDYFSPYSAAECLSRIEPYLDPVVLEAKVRRISESYAPTSWDQCFLELEAALARARSRRT